MKIALPQRARVRIEMLPLIDIVFLLLVVFIYAMLSMAVHHGMPVNLPVSTTATLEQELILSVTIKAAEHGKSVGQIYVDEFPVRLDDLSMVLAERANKMREQGTPEPGILLFADRTIAYQQLFEVLDRINQAGLTRISLQADVDD